MVTPNVLPAAVVMAPPADANSPVSGELIANVLAPLRAIVDRRRQR